MRYPALQQPVQPQAGYQIRSYVLDQSRIKDLRINYEVGNTQAVLDGDFDDFISASLKQGV